MRNQNESEMLAEMFSNFIERLYNDGRIDDDVLSEFLEWFCISDINKYNLSSIINILITYTENKRIQKTLLETNAKIANQLLDETNIQEECEKWYYRKQKEIEELQERINMLDEEIRQEEDERPK